MTEQLIVMFILLVLYEIGFYRGRCSAKDKYYIKGYRDGIYDGKSMFNR